MRYAIATLWDKLTASLFSGADVIQAVKNPSSASRRQALKVGLAATVAAILPFGARAQDAQPAPAAPPPAQPTSSPDNPGQFGSPEQPFTFDVLSARMQEAAKRAYQAPENDLPDVVKKLTYDQHRAIRYRPDHALWRAEPVEFHLQAFYPGWVFQDTTSIFIGKGGVYQRHNFAASDFEYRPPLDPTKFQDLNLDGVAGFRIHAPLERPDYFDELVTFLGASYFRALGMGTRYGLSARGLAINTATSDVEEFPRFTAFFVEEPQPGNDTIRLMAALDSASLTGAYSFAITPGPQTVIDVVARLYMRNEVTRLGIAPLTSMFTFGENDRTGRDDFRPEVHDSDGLYIQRSSGERLWRPLKNPPDLALSYFQETSPRAFGLLQRDRDFSHYEDTEARYELRPSLLIEPEGEWGAGTVELVEIPTDSEANDNIVAFWVPEDKPKAGGAVEYRYKMNWGLLSVPPGELATIGATLVGVGGNGADTGATGRRFALNFVGGTIANLPPDAQLDPSIDLPSNARLVNSSIGRLPDGGWRLSLELEKLDSEPVELRVKLSMLQRVVSETWLYQWVGPAS